MTTTEKQELRRIAREAEESGVEWLDADEWRAVMADDWADYVARVNPSAILQLLEELEACKADAVTPKAIDVVGYASPGQIEVLRSIPKTGGMKVKGSPDKRYTEPLVTQSAARSAVLQAVIRCEQAGAFKTCMECGYQDGHDEICSFQESKRNSTLLEASKKAAREIPEGWEIRICISKDQGGVDLIDPKGELADFIPDNNGVVQAVLKALVEAKHLADKDG